MGSGLRAWYFGGYGHGAVLRNKEGAKQSQRADLIKIRHPTHVPYGEEKGSVEKAYLITRELNE